MGRLGEELEMASYFPSSLDCFPQRLSQGKRGICRREEGWRDDGSFLAKGPWRQRSPGDGLERLSANIHPLAGMVLGSWCCEWISGGGRARKRQVRFWCGASQKTLTSAILGARNDQQVVAIEFDGKGVLDVVWRRRPDAPGTTI